jgi:hypothetical protein
MDSLGQEQEQSGFKCQWRNPKTGKRYGSYKYSYASKARLQNHILRRHAISDNELQTVSCIHDQAQRRVQGNEVEEMSNALALAQKQVISVAHTPTTFQRLDERAAENTAFDDSSTSTVSTTLPVPIVETAPPPSPAEWIRSPTHSVFSPNICNNILRDSTFEPTILEATSSSLNGSPRNTQEGLSNHAYVSTSIENNKALGSSTCESTLEDDGSLLNEFPRDTHEESPRRTQDASIIYMDRESTQAPDRQQKRKWLGASYSEDVVPEYNVKRSKKDPSQQLGSDWVTKGAKCALTTT